MTSPPKHSPIGACLNKRSFPVRGDAYRARRALMESRDWDGRPLIVYGYDGQANDDRPCQWCRGWHFGHRDPEPETINVKVRRRPRRKR